MIQYHASNKVTAILGIVGGAVLFILNSKDVIDSTLFGYLSTAWTGIIGVLGGDGSTPA